MKYTGEIKSVYMMPSEFGFINGKSNHNWHQLSSLTTGWVCWKFHNIGGPSELTIDVCEHNLWSKKIDTERISFPKDILQSSIVAKQHLKC